MEGIFMRKWQQEVEEGSFKILGVDDEETLLRGLKVHINRARIHI